MTCSELSSFTWGISREQFRVGHNIWAIDNNHNDGSSNGPSEDSCDFHDPRDPRDQIGQVPAVQFHGASPGIVGMTTQTTIHGLTIHRSVLGVNHQPVTNKQP